MAVIEMSRDSQAAREPVRYLVFSASLRAESLNAKLARLAIHTIEQNEGMVDHASMREFDAPSYDQDIQDSEGFPSGVEEFRRRIEASDAFVIVSPEYNASFPGALKNSIDWVSRVRERNDPPLAAFKGRVFALGSTSPGALYGGMRGLLALRQSLEIGCGAVVIPDQITVMNAEHAFNEKDELADTRAANQLRNVAQKLVDTARLMT